MLHLRWHYSVPLAQAGLHESFRKLARIEGQDMRILDPQGKVLWEESTPPDCMDRPEIDRPVLRSLLLDSLEPDTIRCIPPDAGCCPTLPSCCQVHCAPARPGALT